MIIVHFFFNLLEHFINFVGGCVILLLSSDLSCAINYVTLEGLLGQLKNSSGICIEHILFTYVIILLVISLARAPIITIMFRFTSTVTLTKTISTLPSYPSRLMPSTLTISCSLCRISLPQIFYLIILLMIAIAIIVILVSALVRTIVILDHIYCVKLI